MSIRHVSWKRWEDAQLWELSEWREWSRRAKLNRLTLGLLGRVIGRQEQWGEDGDDWNTWWRDQFEGYAAVPAQIDELIELGCGPFTNTRLLLKGRTVRRVICSDPLAREYVRFQRGWLAQQYRNASVLIDDHPVEECPYRDESFDVVLMINVLDHVRDADLCLKNASRIVRQGGLLLLGQDLTDEEDLRKTANDTGHPIKLDAEAIEPHLGPFDPILSRQLGRSEGRNPEGHCGTLIFIGRKRTP